MSLNALIDQFVGSSPKLAASRAVGGLNAKGGISTAGLAGGAAVAGLAGVLLGSKKGRKVATSALKYGGVAAIGALA